MSWRLTLFAMAGAIGLLLSAGGEGPTRIVYNPTASAPIGFYWIDDGPITRGDFVLVTVPDRIKNLVIGRGYLPANTPLVKRVLGLDGDEICRFGQVVFWNRKPVAIAKTTDNLGRSLPRWRGCFSLTRERIFLLQDHPDSLDGRYFGPIDRRLILGRARLFLSAGR